jgi:hypothetical protein
LIDHLVPDRVVPPGVVVGGVFLTGDELFGMEELAVDTSTDLICKKERKV